MSVLLGQFSTNLILKKINKDNFGRKKTHKENVVAIDNVLSGKLQCFPQYNRQRQFRKNHKKTFREIL
jgi:hypothetical protein